MERLSIYEVINRIVPVFREYGYDGASLTLLATASGLSRGSLYHHFPGGKVDMARAVLARSGAALSRLILAPLSRSVPVEDRISAMFEGVHNYYQGEPPVCLMNSLTLGSGRDLFGGDVSTAVAAWHEALATTLRSGDLSHEAATKLATAAIERIQGCLILSRVSGTRSTFEESVDNLKSDILTHF